MYLYWVLTWFVLLIHCHTIFLKQEMSEIYTRYILSDTVNPAKRNVALYKNDTCKYMQKRYV